MSAPTARQLAELAQAAQVLRAEDAKRAQATPLSLAKALGFVPDPWQERLLAAQGNVLLKCSRQAGKSTGASLLVVHRALSQPNHLALLISPSLRQSGELFRKVRDFADRVPGMKLTEDNASSVTFANGSRIVSLPSSENTVRGFSSVNTLVEDEAAFVDDALNHAIRPMLAVSKGQLILMSTPNGRRGHFYEAWTGKGPWHREEVTCWQVPRISREFLEEERRVLGEVFKQEYECQFINALTGRVYRYTPELNVIDVAPEGPWELVLGLDPGVRDRNGVTVLGWRPHDRCVYVLMSYVVEGTPTDLAEEVHRLRQTLTFSSILCDEGGMGKAYAEEMRRRHHIPVEMAEKHAKAATIRLLNADMASGLVKVVGNRCEGLLEEWDSLPWREDGMREAEGYKADQSDATLYAWRKAMAFVERPKAPLPTRAQAIAEEEERLIAAMERQAAESADGGWDGI